MTQTSKTTPSSGRPAIVFFGSGPVSAQSLELLKESFVIEAVVTKPTTEAQMARIAVDIPVYTVRSKAELDQLIEKRPFTSQVAVLIDFGIIVSQTVIDYFPKGIINSHFSLLPQLRGADPISFAILEGLDKTGVSLMLLTAGMDEGPLLGCGIQALDGSETTPPLTDKLISLSDALLKREIPRYLASESKAIDQSKISTLIPDYPDKPTYSRKLTKEDGILDFNKPAKQLEREIRAFIDWPKSRTIIGGKDVIITKAHAVPGVGAEDKPGDITPVKEAGIIMVATSNGSLCIEELKPAGKNTMTAAAFLAGYGHSLTSNL